MCHRISKQGEKRSTQMLNFVLYCNVTASTDARQCCVNGIDCSVCALTHPRGVASRCVQIWFDLFAKVKFTNYFDNCNEDVHLVYTCIPYVEQSRAAVHTLRLELAMFACNVYFVWPRPVNGVARIRASSHRESISDAPVASVRSRQNFSLAAMRRLFVSSASRRLRRSTAAWYVRYALICWPCHAYNELDIDQNDT